MPLSKVLNSRIFISFLILGLIEPSGIQDLAVFSGGIWRITHLVFVLIMYMDIALLFALALLTLKKLSIYSIFCGLFTTVLFVSDIMHGALSSSELLFFAQMLGLTVCVDLYVKIGALERLTAVIAFWLGLFIIINFATVLAYPDGMYLDNRGWTANFFLGYKNRFPYYFLPYLAFEAIYEILRFKKIKIWYLVMQIIMLISAILGASSTGTVVVLVSLAMTILANSKELPPFLNARVAFVVSALLSVGIIFFQVQTQFSSLIHELFGKDATFTGRTLIWDASIKDILKSPWIGNGNTEVNINLDWDVFQCHNKFLDIAFVSGLFGIVLFFVVIFIATKNLHVQQGNTIANLLTFALFGYAIIFLMESRRADPLMFLVFAVAYHVKAVPIVTIKRHHLFKRIKFVFGEKSDTKG